MRSSITVMTKKGRLTFASALLLFVGCGGGETSSQSDSDVLLRAGDEVLTMKEVVRNIPVGIEAADSAAMFHLIVDNWIKSKVLSGLAERKLSDVAEIDNKVADYRNRLIVAEYLQEMKKGKDFKVRPDSIREFYNHYKGDMLLESPLVKGIYIKVAADRSNLDEIRGLVFCGSDECIDQLDKTSAGDAVQYDYFINDWVDWQTIADRIPYRFYDPDAFLKSTGNFETSYNGSVYLLHISAFLPTGSEPPYEFAAIRIGEMMERTNIKKFEESLVKSLVNKAISDGDLVAVGYDPVLSEINPGFSQRFADETEGESRENMNDKK